MRTVLFASVWLLSTTILFTSSVSRAQQPAPAHWRLFDPVIVPPDSLQVAPATCIAPAGPASAPAAQPAVVSVSSGATSFVSTSSGLTPSVAASSASPSRGKDEDKSALPNSDALPPAAAFARVPVAPEPRPDSRARFIVSNGAMFGATFFHAFGRQIEVNNCKKELGIKNGVYTGAPYRGQTPGTQAKFYAIALPIDAGVSLLSVLARHKGWRSLEIAGPMSAATAHITAGAFKLATGCY